MSQTLGLGVTIAAVGVTAATGGASAQITIPNDSSGRVPSYIRVAGINECYVKLGVAGVVATTNDVLIQPADSIILQVPKGVTTIAHIQGTTAGKINVIPLENS